MLSSVPAIKNRLLYLFRGLLAIFDATSIYSTTRPALFCTSDFTQANRHGYRQWKKQQQASGMKLRLDSLHRSCSEQKGESATMTSHQLLSSRLTEPILRPQPTTLWPSFFKYAAAMSTSLASWQPRVIKSVSNLLPQPLKSKQASPTPGGSSLRCMQPSKRLELLPCRYSITQSMSLVLQRVSLNGSRCYSTLKAVLYFSGGFSNFSLYMKRGGRISMQLNWLNKLGGSYYFMRYTIGGSFKFDWLCSQACQVMAVLKMRRDSIGKQL